MAIFRTHTQSFSHRGRQYASVADRVSGQRFVRVDAPAVLAYFHKAGHVIEPYPVGPADLKAMDLEQPLPLDPHHEYSEAEIADFKRAMSEFRAKVKADFVPPIVPAVVDDFDPDAGAAEIKRGPGRPRKA